MRLSKSSVKIISANVFRCCERLPNFKMPVNISKIGDNEFEHFVNLESITVPLNVEIGKEAFRECSKLKTFNFLPPITTIKSNVFNDNSTLINSVMNKAFVASEDTEGNILEICSSTFEYCVNLESFKIPSTVKKIGKSEFREYKKLNLVEVPDSVVEIEAGAFEDCPNLKCICIPDPKCKVHPNAFRLSNTKVLSKCYQ